MSADLRRGEDDAADLRLHPSAQERALGPVRVSPKILGPRLHLLAIPGRREQRQRRTVSRVHFDGLVELLHRVSKPRHLRGTRTPELSGAGIHKQAQPL